MGFYRVLDNSLKLKSSKDSLLRFLFSEKNNSSKKMYITNQ
jgi:hypothetical protein